MKAKFFALTLATSVLTGGIAPLMPSALAQAAEGELSFTYFYETLAPYGEWIEVGDYGLCWHPLETAEDWAPYTDGYWSYTDAGWTWVSYEEFGGIVYHYGRWVKAEDTGWVWVPGDQWGPAWVSWRQSDDEDTIGWAPLPPEARYTRDVGVSVWVDSQADIGPGSYNFCRTSDFGAPVLREVIIPRPRNVTIIETTVNITNISVNNYYDDDYDRGVPFCGGPRYEILAERVARPIPTFKLVRETNINNITNINVDNSTVIVQRGRRPIVQAFQQGNTLTVPAPRIRRMDLAKSERPKPVRVIAAEKVTRGWDVVKAPEKRRELAQKLRRQAKDAPIENAPARPIQTAELKVVPEKADRQAPSPVATGRNRRPRPERGAASTPGAPSVEPSGTASVTPADPTAKEKGPQGKRPAASADGVDGAPDRQKGKMRPGKEDAAPVAAVPGQPDGAAPTGKEKEKPVRPERAVAATASEASEAAKDKTRKRGPDGPESPAPGATAGTAPNVNEPKKPADDVPKRDAADPEPAGPSAGGKTTLAERQRAAKEARAKEQEATAEKAAQVTATKARDREMQAEAAKQRQLDAEQKMQDARDRRAAQPAPVERPTTVERMPKAERPSTAERPPTVERVPKVERQTAQPVGRGDVAKPERPSAPEMRRPPVERAVSPESNRKPQAQAEAVARQREASAAAAAGEARRRQQAEAMQRRNEDAGRAAAAAAAGEQRQRAAEAANAQRQQAANTQRQQAANAQRQQAAEAQRASQAQAVREQQAARQREVQQQRAVESQRAAAAQQRAAAGEAQRAAAKQRQIQMPPPTRPAPAAGEQPGRGRGKRPLTPEEAALLQRQGR